MNDNASQKYRLESMQQELNQFSRAANDILSRQYLNADTLRKLNIEVPPNKTAFWCIFILLAIFLSFVTQTFIPGLVATAYAIFKMASEQTAETKNSMLNCIAHIVFMTGVKFILALIIVPISRK